MLIVAKYWVTQYREGLVIISLNLFKRWFRSEESGNGFRGGYREYREIEIVMVIGVIDSRNGNNYRGNAEYYRYNGDNFGGNSGNNFGDVRRGCVQERNSPSYRLRHLSIVEGYIF